MEEDEEGEKKEDFEKQKEAEVDEEEEVEEEEKVLPVLTSTLPALQWTGVRTISAAMSLKAGSNSSRSQHVFHRAALNQGISGFSGRSCRMTHITYVHMIGVGIPISSTLNSGMIGVFPYRLLPIRV